MVSRIDRINSLIRAEISNIISREIKDPRINLISITYVKTTRDLSLSKVYFSSLRDSDSEEILKGLESASGFIRKCLKKRLDIKRIPMLVFAHDSSMEHGDKIQKILKNLKDEKK